MLAGIIVEMMKNLGFDIVQFDGRVDSSLRVGTLRAPPYCFLFMFPHDVPFLSNVSRFPIRVFLFAFLVL